MKQSILATRYLNAFTQSLPDAEVKENLETLNMIISAVLSEEILFSYLLNPTIQNNDKQEIVTSFLNEIKASETIANFLKLLIEKDRLSLLEDLNLMIRNNITALNKEIDADISSHEPFSEANKAILLQYLSDITERSIKANFIEDSDSLGGFKAKVGNTILDGSLENSLSKLNQTFMSLN